ncbi:YceI family protein [Paenibacillus ginsengihumi]|uniref:YceI family protein n=1 Tax=Paenibacillus ginsengihumi TaxID=431596 RepID=UPI0003822985|nr:YceI family protein [Paenibacillus ginsengihumi]
MNKKMVAFAAGVLVVLGGGYAAYDYFVGNHVTIQEAIPAAAPAQSGTSVAASELDGVWSIRPDSKVYVSVTTSKETVNFEGSSVQGSWTVNTSDFSQMKVEAKLQIDSLQSGNAQRDNHVQGEKFLNAAQYPEAVFTLQDFANFPQEWKEGERVSFDMNGTLTVKGISKDVTFKSEAMYNQGVISMEGSAVVTFDDFGMQNPHTVLLDSQNDVTVQLRL